MSHPVLLPKTSLVFHHLGLAVRRPDEAIVFLSALGYQMGQTILDPLQNVQLKLCTHEAEPVVEIIWPGESKGPLEGILKRHPTGIVYHMCYLTDDLDAALAALKNAGLQVDCISPPKPAPLFGVREVSFYNVIGIGLIEILA